MRGEAELTQHELAERSGVHRQSIARLELGTREPSWEMVQKLARALGVPVGRFTDPALIPTEKAPRPRRRPRKAAGRVKPATRKGKRK